MPDNETERFKIGFLRLNSPPPKLEKRDRNNRREEKGVSQDHFTRAIAP